MVLRDKNEEKNLIVHYLWFRRIETEIYVTERKLNDEVDTHKKYIVDDCRRVHNYDEFITTFISMLGNLIVLSYYRYIYSF